MIAVTAASWPLVTPRGNLAEDEQATMNLFATASPVSLVLFLQS